MKRGDVFLVLLPGSPAAKPRPCVIVQRDNSLADSAKVTVCPLSSVLHGRDAQRPMVTPARTNGLRATSEVEIDWVFTAPLSRFGPRIGDLDRDTMNEVDVALSRWLGL